MLRVAFRIYSASVAVHAILHPSIAMTPAFNVSLRSHPTMWTNISHILSVAVEFIFESNGIINGVWERKSYIGTFAWSACAGKLDDNRFFLSAAMQWLNRIQRTKMRARVADLFSDWSVDGNEWMNGNEMRLRNGRSIISSQLKFFAHSVIFIVIFNLFLAEPYLNYKLFIWQGNCWVQTKKKKLKHILNSRSQFYFGRKYWDWFVKNSPPLRWKRIEEIH